ncbi:MAG: hypothetical protein EOO41_03480, partial [Methanobacteriota archaeon]
MASLQRLQTCTAVGADNSTGLPTTSVELGDPGSCTYRTDDTPLHRDSASLPAAAGRRVDEATRIAPPLPTSGLATALDRPTSAFASCVPLLSTPAAANVASSLTCGKGPRRPTTGLRRRGVSPARATPPSGVESSAERGRVRIDADSLPLSPGSRSTSSSPTSSAAVSTTCSPGQSRCASPSGSASVKVAAAQTAQPTRDAAATPQPLYSCTERTPLSTAFELQRYTHTAGGLPVLHASSSGGSSGVAARQVEEDAGSPTVTTSLPYREYAQRRTHCVASVRSSPGVTGSAPGSGLAQTASRNAYMLVYSRVSEARLRQWVGMPMRTPSHETVEIRHAGASVYGKSMPAAAVCVDGSSDDEGHAVVVTSAPSTGGKRGRPASSAVRGRPPAAATATKRARADSAANAVPGSICGGVLPTDVESARGPQVRGNTPSSQTPQKTQFPATSRTAQSVAGKSSVSGVAQTAAVDRELVVIGSSAFQADDVAVMPPPPTSPFALPQNQR